jgi:hypothetical protein
MAYSEFTLAQVREKFGLIIEEPDNLFAEVSGIEPSQTLQTFVRIQVAGY